MSKEKIVGIILFFSLSTLSAQSPGWLFKRPRSDNFFYGRGKGVTVEDAEIAGRREILLQLSSQVNGLIRSEDSSTEEIESIDNMIVSFFDAVRLRTAEVEDLYETEGESYALVRYPESSALIISQTGCKTIS